MKTPVTHLTRQARHEFEMDAIAACFIGGTAVTGGIGTIPGAMVGALIMGVLNQGLSIMGVDAAWVKTIKGLVVIAAVALMRVSIAAALSAMPPQPQMPIMPMRSGSTSGLVER